MMLTVSYRCLPMLIYPGDLTDAKAADYSGSGQLIQEWEMYR
jgi:hypothetical protein